MIPAFTAVDSEKQSTKSCPVGHILIFFSSFCKAQRSCISRPTLIRNMNCSLQKFNASSVSKQHETESVRIKYTQQRIGRMW